MSQKAPKRGGLPPPVLASLYVGLVAVPMVAALLSEPGHWQGAMRLATACGIAAAVMVLAQMLTSGRFEAISGRIGIDVTMAFHKWAAPLALLLALVHVLALIGLPDPDRPGRLARRLEFVLTAPGFWDGRIALALLTLVVLLALLRDRLPMRYQIWRAGHALGALGLVVALLWHVLGDGPGGAAMAALWLGLTLAACVPALSVYAGRLVRPEAQRWTVAENRSIAEKLWLLRLSPPPGRSLAFQPGQFAWVAFGAKRLPLHDHPFSIASPPGEAEVRLVVQEAGDFTQGIGAIAVGTEVSLDAPHGSFVPRGEGPLILVAGGVGIAPILSILGALAQAGNHRPVRFLYAARSAAAMVPAELYRPACETLGVAPMLISDTPEDHPGMLQGPMSAALLERAMEGLEPSACEVMICGPGPMMTLIADSALAMGVPLDRIDYERFRYGAGATSVKDRLRLTVFAATLGAVLGLVLLYWLA